LRQQRFVTGLKVDSDALQMHNRCINSWEDFRMVNDVDDVGDGLRALVNDTSSRSETARLRDIFDHVEATLQKGVRREAVLEHLKKNLGFTMTMTSFKSALQRIRKERK
jgi:hypothetical protein